ncbi:MAG: M14 family metallopeptidase [Patescibacteria group bacterium]
MKNIIIGILVIVVFGFGLYFILPNSNDNSNITQYQNTPTNLIPQNNSQTTQATSTQENKNEFTLGKSVNGKEIMAYQYGKGETEILFIGGIHGGYEWNTSMLAYEAIDYFKANQDKIPANIKITIIPVLNPDGLSATVGTSERFEISDVPTLVADTVAGRFNANEVDLNRNFDCDWQASGTWQNKTVSGGTQVFSEPESQAIRKYVGIEKPQAVIVWYSAAGGVYSSSCHNGISTETKNLTSTYAKASGYTGHEEFDSYAITGDMVNWLAKENIPAISVLLTNHTDVEWTENKAGIEAVLKYYSK